MRHFYTPQHEPGGRLLPDIRPYAVVRCTSAGTASACASAAADADDEEWWDEGAAAAGGTWGEERVRKQLEVLTGCAVVLDDPGALPAAAWKVDADGPWAQAPTTPRSTGSAPEYLVDC